MVQLIPNMTRNKTELPLPILLITINNKCRRGGLWLESQGACHGRGPAGPQEAHRRTARRREV